MKFRPLALGAALLVLTTTACGIGGQPQSVPQPEPAEIPTVTVMVDPTTPPPPAPTTVTETQTQTQTSTATPVPSTTSAPAAPPTTSAPTYIAPTDTEIRDEVGGAFTTVNIYWTNLFSTWQDPQGRPVSWRVPNLMNGNGFYDSARGNPFDCGRDQNPVNASFCPYNDPLGGGMISWDMELFRESYGDAPIYATVAHEVAHAAQARFWADGEGKATPNPETDLPAYEQQADCFAGATIAKAEQDGYLTIEPGDIEEISIFFLSMESGGDHGNAADRLTEFQYGYNGDVESCLYNEGVPPH